MEKNRNQKLLMIIALVLSIASLSIGFAAFSVSLNISSQASVSPSSDTFSVKFSTNKDSLVVSSVTPSSNPYNLTTTNGIIDNSTNPTIKGLSATFTNPGQYVEYTFYARNEGEYTAYLNNINFIGNKTCKGETGTTDSLVQSACESINITATIGNTTYRETTPITGHSLNKKTGEQIKVRISYDIDGQVIAEPFSITFGNIAMIYSTIDDSTYIPPDNTLGKTLLMDIIKEGAISDSSVDFASSAGLDVENNTAFFMNTTINDTNPIYYYRGNVTKNNVKFANFCWKIVRTTETGGIKLVYNGVPGEDGYCDNTGNASKLGISTFYSSSKSPAYVGYMYGTVYTVEEKDLSAQTDTYVYGNDVTWDGTNYTITDTMASSSWATDRSTLMTKYHYTCFNDTGVCDKVYYINYFGNASYAYYLTLSDGKDIEDAKDEMFTNTTDSKIKTKIDTWYASNMKSYTYMLEDTVWCNDRTLIGGPLYSKDTSVTENSIFAAYKRNISTFNPSITCSNTRDSFTVDSKNGNGKLTYPVGLLTADEITLIGSGSQGYSVSSYLETGESMWSLSPYNFEDKAARGFCVGNGFARYCGVTGSSGVRPSISLKPGTYVSDGDGSVYNPFIVELI